MNEKVEIDETTVQGWTAKELLKHPGSIFVYLLLAGGSAGVTLNPFITKAEASDQFQAIETRLTKVEEFVCNIDEVQTKDSLRSIESDLLSLQRAIDQGTATEAEKHFYSKLKSEQVTLGRKAQNRSLCGN